MLDELRRNEWTPRSVYKNMRLIANIVKKIENNVGRTAKHQEIAAELNLNIEDYYQLIKEAMHGQVYGFQDLGLSEDAAEANNYNEPHELASRKNLSQYLKKAKSKLSQKEQLVLSLYYEQELNLKEIGTILCVSESRVSQIHAQALINIKAKIVRLN